MKDELLVEYRAELSVFLLIILGLAMFIGILGAATNNEPTGSLSVFHDLVSAFGGWVYWLALVGTIGFLIVLWWAIDFVLKIRKLKELMDTESKAKFIKIMDDVEYIAWRLPKRYKDMVAQKKVDLKIVK